ncbi:MAG: hypothetical protein IPP35_02390 [Elusimicrobia bacterium]|nr:hypothetical protein [Elusimicrobiota bacterium]
MTLLAPSNIQSAHKGIGSKTLRLKKCLDAGFPVPPFVAIPSEDCQAIRRDVGLRMETTGEIHNALDAQTYAVRSSALIEDGDQTSMAGQFQTRCGVPPAGLSDAIREVLDHADGVLQGQMNKFSLLVQSFVEPDFSGVCFTRNPQGGREMVFEYHQGRGEKLVGGEIQAERLSLLWNHALPPTAARIPGFAKLLETCKAVEELFGAPQDIEWCLQAGILHILQSRPITSISKNQYAQILFLVSVLPSQEPFLYDKSPVTEMAPRPTSLTLDVLKEIHRDTGPVAGVYRRFGIDFRDTDFFKQIGNELFVDKEKEIKSLLPSYSVVNSPTLTPRMTFSGGWWATIKNLAALSLLPARFTDRAIQRLEEELRAKLAAPWAAESPEKVLARFLEDYESVFETNLLAGIAVKSLEIALKGEAEVSEILQTGGPLLAPAEGGIPEIREIGWLGNSLDLADETEFLRCLDPIQKPSPGGWDALPEKNKKSLATPVRRALRSARLREWGRWLTVRGVNKLRRAVLDWARGKGIKDARLVHFARWEEIRQRSGSGGGLDGA